MDHFGESCSPSNNNSKMDAVSTAPAATTSEMLLFVEFPEAMECIGIITSYSFSTDDERRISRTDRNQALSKLRDIFDKYLEMPSLLDRNLPDMIRALSEPATELLINLPRHDDDSNLPYILSALYALSKVRGRKRVQKFLPHEVHFVEPALNALIRMDQEETDKKNEELENDNNDAPPGWESTYTLWNWIGKLSLVPFDASVVADTELVSSLIQLAKKHLTYAGPAREIAAASLASWLSRPDLEAKELPAFVEWSKQQLAREKRKPSLFETMGILQTSVCILKVSTSERTNLLDTMLPLWDPILAICEEQPSNLLLRRYLVKWWTRLGRHYLPPRIAPWRYSRGHRSLKENLANANTTYDKPKSENLDTLKTYQTEIFHVPDEVEVAMGHVIGSLADSATSVRWSAAKGVGRLTERLPAICAEDVLDAILKSFRDREQDHAWHGGCLALAELIRRGLLLPHRLPDVVPLIVQAIQYDVPRRMTSVGSNVRDAACYTYWSCARAYDPLVLKPYVQILSESIIVSSLFDREVNCRRAASAAFQEFVGRQGATNFPNGIDILTAADYFSLGNRTDAYTSIALHIAKYEEYRQPIIKHLYMSKLSHWDPTIRKLASKSFQLLAPLDWRFICSEVLPYLLDSSLDSYVQIRHGAVLGVAEIVLSFSDIKEEVQTPDLLSSALVDSIAQLVPTIEKKRLYRGKGGEQMRAAVCRFIECLSIARVPLTVPQQVRLLDSLDACIPHPSEDIQEQACKALSALMRSYFPVGAKGPSDRLQKRVVDKYAKEVRTSINPAATRGFSLALGHLPAKLLAPSPRVVDITLSCLCRSSRPDALVGKEKDAETRRNALVSLAKVCTEIGILPREDDVTCIVGISAKQMEHVFKAFFNAIGDYNVERRGDVGSWSRIKAMDGLEALVMLIASEGMSESSEYFTRDICSRVFGSLLKQMSEKLDAVRAHAAGCLLRLLSASNPGVPLVPAKERLCEIFLARDDSVINWADASKSFPMLLEAATIEEYFDSIISGLIISVGCLTESVSKSATRALLQNVKELDVQFTKNLGRVFLELFSKHQKEGRVTLPLLKTISILLDHMCMDPLLKDHVFTSSLLDNLKEEESGCNDVPRLFEITKVLLGCLQGKDIQKDVLALICQLLSHRFPRVRRYAAENLYVALLEHPDILGSVTVAEDHPIMEMLLNDPWDSEMDESTLESLAKNVSERLRIEVTP